jgi:hypothetical protein
MLKICKYGRKYPEKRKIKLKSEKMRGKRPGRNLKNIRNAEREIGENRMKERKIT